MHIYHTAHAFAFSLKCCVVLLTNAFLSLWMQSRFFGAILRNPGLHKSWRNPSASPKSHSDMSHSQISPQGAGWGNIFNLNLDTIGPVRHRKNGLGVLKPQKPLPETRLSINTRYSPQLPSSLFSLPLSLSLSLSCWALHSYIYYIIIQTLGNWKKNSTNKKNKSSGSVVLLLKEHLSPALPLRVGVG